MANRTLKEGGGVIDGGVLPTSSEITSTTQVAPVKTQADSGLSKDILGLLGDVSDVTSTGYNISKKAATRVSTNSLTELNLELDIIEKATNKNSSESMRRADELSKGAYQKFGRRTFDNEDAQKAFDEQYHTIGSKTISKNSVYLQTSADKLDDISLQEKSEHDWENFIVGNMQVDNKTLTGEVEKMTAYGRVSTEDAQYHLADRNTTAFDTKTRTGLEGMLTRNGGEKGGMWTPDVATNVFNENFSAFATMDKKTGEIVWEKNVENKAREEILGKWKTFTSAMNTKNKSSADPFARTKKEINNNRADAEKGFIPVSEQQGNLDKLEQQKINIENEANYSEGQLQGINIAIEEAKNEIQITNQIALDFKTIDSTALSGYLKEGRTFKMRDAKTGLMIKHKIEPNRYTNAAKHYLNKESEQTLNIQITDSTSADEFRKGVFRTKQLEQILPDMESGLSQRYEGITESGNMKSIRDTNSAKQLIEYNSVMLDFDKTNEVKRQFNNEITEVVNNSDYDEKTKVSIIQNKIQTAQNNETNALLNLEINAYIKQVIDKSKSGKSWFQFEAVVSTGANVAMMKAVYQKQMTGDYESYIDSTEDSMVDIGTTTKVGDKDQRFIPPIGNETTLRGAVKSLIVDFNKANGKQYDESDIYAKNDYKNGNYTVEFFTKNGDKSLGEVNGQNAYRLNNKYMNKKDK